ncbi:MAG TPA: NAD(P)H-hydrate dehydratase [Mycobacteriales bacterium]|jgi:hydroxyethylthiazole kinase-like uncharacterized protein yjeF
MRGVWPVAAVRAAEEALMAQLPDGVLMQRAAAGLATHCAAALDRVYGARVVLLVGAGNNGGDALYAGARLAARGARVDALLLAPDRAHAGGLAALRAAGGRAVPARPEAVAGADLVVDGILGIGGKGGLRPDAAALAQAGADSGATLVAVDLPSGVDADTGAVAGAAFDADLTVTFGVRKPGLIVGEGARHAGEVALVDIGLLPYLPAPDTRVLEDADVRQLLPVPGPGDDKYTRGVAGIVAGSPTYGGAAVMCVGAALHTGAGMVRYAGHAADAVRARWPEAVVTDGRPTQAGRVQAWVVGPGLGVDDDARALLREVLHSDVPVLVDADGITLLAAEPDLVRRRTAPTVLTPHDREFARVAGDVGTDRIGAAKRAAADLGVTMLLKGNATVVAAPDGHAYVNPTGTPWLASAGTGDVLSGCIGALLAAGLPAPEAAASGAYLHGLAGALAADGAPTTAVGVLTALPAARRRLPGRS